MRAFAALLAVLLVSCEAIPGRVVTNAPPRTGAASAATTASPTASITKGGPTAAPAQTAKPIADVLTQIDAAKLDDHMRALTSFQSRHPLHPGHAKAVAYLIEQLSAIPGVVVQDIPTSYNGVRLDNILATIGPPGPRPDGFVDVAGMICAH